MEYEDMMHERAQEAMQKQWSRQEWTPSPALSTKTREGTSVTKFVGQKYNPKKTELIENGWDHDHCLFCSQSICSCGGENCDPVGFTDGNQWVCESCHKRIIVDGENPTST
jgi:hypothetical protein